MRRLRRGVCLAASAGVCLAAVAGARLSAQSQSSVQSSAQSNDGPVLRTPPKARTSATHAAGPELVRLPLLVLDKHGQPMTNVTAAQLTLTEDGDAETIGKLEPSSAVPLQLGLLLDTSRAMEGSLDAVRKAGSALVDGMLPAGGANREAFLIHFDREVELLEDF